MSSIQDRIRRLQSAENPKTKPSVSALSSSITKQTSTPSNHAPTDETLSKNVQANNDTRLNVGERVKDFTMEQEAVLEGGLRKKVDALEMGAETGKLKEKLWKIEQRGEDIANVGGKVGMFERAENESGNVSGRRGVFEKGQGGGGNDDNTLKGRLGVFEKGGGNYNTREKVKDKEELINKRDSGLMKRLGVFERANEGKGDLEGVPNDDSALKSRLGVIESGGEDKAEEKVKEKGGNIDRKKSDLMKRLGVFEKGSEGNDHDDAERGGHDHTALKDKHAVYEKGVEGNSDEKVEDKEESIARKESGLLKRAAMFENTAKEQDQVVKGVSNMAVKDKVAEKKLGDVVSKKKVDTVEKKSLVDELKDVKHLNKELIARLVELTAAFNTLEKGREQLQARLKRLEQK